MSRFICETDSELSTLLESRCCHLEKVPYPVNRAIRIQEWKSSASENSALRVVVRSSLQRLLRTAASLVLRVAQGKTFIVNIAKKFSEEPVEGFEPTT